MPKMPERDPQTGRALTSHERGAGQVWDASYQHGLAPWEIGRPQPAIERLAATGAFRGTVLDVGCGTGESTLLVASLGLPVLGVDVAPTALEAGRRNAAVKDLAAEFKIADALHLERLDRRFDTVVDSGLFHSFDASEREAYAGSLAAVTEPGAKLYLLCFSEEAALAPHPVSRAQLEAAFMRARGWETMSIVAERIHANIFGPEGAPAWLASFKRIAPAPA